MIYEAVLLFGVVFAVSYALMATMKWSYPLSPAARVIVQIMLFVVIGAYFVVCWSRSGQTLALKAWNLSVVDASGEPPHTARAVARYLLAWHLWVPGLLVVAALEPPPGAGLAALAASFALLLTPALLDRDRRLLHDRCTGTRVVRVPLRPLAP
jgi:uncharacterized RDD family membrane protein YckC